MLVGSALLTLSDAFTKMAAAALPTGEIIVIRSGMSIVVLAILVARAGSIGVLRVRNMRSQVLRAAVMLAGTFSFVTGLGLLPLAEALAVSFAGPLFVTALAPLMLAEVVGWRRRIAVVVGFIGVVVIIRPTGEGLNWAVLFPLASALFSALRDIVTRRMSATESSASILLFATLALILGGLTTLPFGWPVPSVWEVGVLLAAGLVQSTGHFIVIESFRHAEAALVIPFKYTMLLWGALFGFLFFSHIPGENVFMGAAIILAATLYILHREAAVSRRRRAAGGG